MVETKFEEEEVVNDLCELSEKFNNFYQKERKKYNDKIEWFQETDLKEGLNAYAKSPEEKGETYKIYFKKFPDADDDFLIAHEIMHVIRAIENESINFDDKNYPDIAKAFRNMIEDPIVDLILSKEYNFDLLAKYREYLDLPRRQIDLMSKKPSKAQRAERIINITKQLRCWKLIRNRNEQKEWVDYQTALKSKFPDIWNESIDFYNFIEETGFDNKEKQGIIMKELNYRLHRE